MSRRPKPHHHSGTKRIEPLFPVSGTCPMLRTTHFYFTSVRQMGGVEVDQPAFSDPQRQNCNLKKITKVTSHPCSEHRHKYSEGHIIQALHALVHIHFFPLPQPSHPTQNRYQYQSISVARSMCQSTFLPPLGGSIIFQRWE